MSIRNKKHSIKSWLGQPDAWVWSCGNCTTTGWERNWATAHSALDNHVYLGHLKRRFLSQKLSQKG